MRATAASAAAVLAPSCARGAPANAAAADDVAERAAQRARASRRGCAASPRARSRLRGRRRRRGPPGLGSSRARRGGCGTMHASAPCLGAGRCALRGAGAGAVHAAGRAAPPCRLQRPRSARASPARASRDGASAWRAAAPPRRAASPRARCAARRRLTAAPGARADGLIYPGRQDDGVILPAFPAVYAGGNSPGAGAAGSPSYSEHKPKTPPPDLPSLLLDSRIVYLGMPVRVPGQATKALVGEAGGAFWRAATRRRPPWPRSAAGARAVACCCREAARSRSRPAPGCARARAQP
jgi:hypothetical protein